MTGSEKQMTQLVNADMTQALKLRYLLNNLRERSLVNALLTITNVINKLSAYTPRCNKTLRLTKTSHVTWNRL